MSENNALHTVGSFVLLNRIENVPPDRTNVVVWWAAGYASWAQQNAEEAIRRDIDPPATGLEFRLPAAAPPMAPGGGGGGGGGGSGGGGRDR